MIKQIISLALAATFIKGQDDLTMVTAENGLCLSFSATESMTAWDPINGTFANFPSATWTDCASNSEQFQYTSDNQIIQGGQCLTLLPISAVFHTSLDACDTWDGLPQAASYLFAAQCEDPPVVHQQFNYDLATTRFTSACPHGFFIGGVGNDIDGHVAFVTGSGVTFGSAQIYSGFIVGNNVPTTVAGTTAAGTTAAGTTAAGTTAAGTTGGPNPTTAAETTAAGTTAGPNPTTTAGTTAGGTTGAGTTAGPNPTTAAGTTAGPNPTTAAGTTAGPNPTTAAGTTAGPNPTTGAGTTAVGTTQNSAVLDIVIPQGKVDAVPVMLEEFLSLSDTTSVSTHGCWCTKIAGVNPDYVGRAVDEVDQLCKEWSTMRHCNTLPGGSCNNVFNVNYSITKVGGPGHPFTCVNSNNNNQCQEDTCLIDATYAQAIAQYITVDNPLWTADPRLPSECERVTFDSGNGGDSSSSNGNAPLSGVRSCQGSAPDLEIVRL